ncbi:hypothetical protein VNO78_06251 [Psophocarpus tetragonolobus]|uniref:Uncharacterized protein n=1 Tax=Psophocarpus tetragonolobus TaxID=3891 RepID=A0AAN9XRE7_PSOTE
MSSITKASPSSNDIMSTEESGWTSYFDDFFNNYVDNNKCSMSLSGVATTSSSLVSDAASNLVEKKVANSKQVEEFNYVNKNVERSSLKKRKEVTTAFIDESLEDTATSPLNKVLYANQKIDKANRQK